jgi:hypothetical protein
MKKVLLTGIAAVFFAIGSMAQTQQQKNKPTESNQYRKGNESRTEQRVDSVGNTIDSNAEKTGRDIKEDVKSTGNDIDRSAEQAGQNMKEGAQRTGDKIQQGAQRTEDSVEQGAQQTGQNIQNGADRAGNAVKEGVNDTGNAIQNGAQRTQDQLNQSTPPEEKNQSQNSPTGNNDSMNGSAATMENNNASQNPVEVVDSKEGPNNEVVYKYQGELYYVDRKEQKLVKAEESQLKDAKNKAVVSTNPVSSDSKTSKMKHRKSNKG